MVAARAASDQKRRIDRRHENHSGSCTAVVRSSGTALAPDVGNSDMQRGRRLHVLERGFSPSAMTWLH
jgi:hypothetical protein